MSFPHKITSYNIVIIPLTALILSAAVQPSTTAPKSQVVEVNPNSKIIKSPTLEAKRKAEKILNNGTTLKTTTRTLVLDANASQLVRAAMDIESGIKVETPAVSEPAPIALPITVSAAVAKPTNKYFEIIEKSFHSIEQDSWTDAAANITEVVNYFAAERELYGKENHSLDDYYDLAIAFANYISAGKELDEAKQPNFKDALSDLRAARSKARQVQSGLALQGDGAALSGLIDSFVKELDTEISYVEDMLAP